MRCLDDNQFNAFFLGELSPDETVRIEAHLASCSDCLRLAAAIGRADSSSSPILDRGESHSTGQEQAPSIPMAITAGDRIGRYVVESFVGRGGMGVVFAARDPELGRRVALKLVHAPGEGSKQERAASRLLREAQALAQISHPNVVTIHDIGRIGTDVFIAMELVEGVSLRRWLRDSSPSLMEILDAFHQVACGLDATHAAGLIHRDLKPDNLLRSRNGTVQIVDFGLARMVLEDVDPDESAVRVRGTALTETLTREGIQPGTPAYMAPEVLAGNRADARSDQFSFCVALYEALYGTLPLPSDPVERLEAARAGRLSPGRGPLAGRVPAWLRRALLRGLAADPAVRFPSMGALGTILDRGPRARRRLLLGGTVMVALGGLLYGAVKLAPAQPRLCLDGQARAAAVWNDGRRLAVRQAVIATGTPQATDKAGVVVDRLDQYVQRWTEMYTEACDAALIKHQRSPQLYERQVLCLQARLDEVRVTSERLARVNDRSLDMVARTVDQLGLLSDCAAGQLIGQVNSIADDERTREAVAALRARLSQDSALLTRQELTRSLATALDVVAEGRRIGHMPLVAEALLRAGDRWADLHKVEMAEYAYYEALTISEREGLPRLTLEILHHLARLVGDVQGRLDEGYRFTIMAQGLAQRYGDVATLVDFENLRGTIRAAQGRGADAITHHREALRLCSTIQPSLAQRPIATTRNLLGFALAREGRHEEALVEYEKALAIRIEVYGPNHTRVAGVLNNMGSSLLALGRKVDAVRAFERALLIRTTSADIDELELVPVLENLAEVRLADRRLDEAAELLDRAVRILEQAMGADHIKSAGLLLARGRLEINRGRSGDARSFLERALHIGESKGASVVQLTEIRKLLAQVRLTTGSRGSSNDRPGRAQSASLARSGGLPVPESGAVHKSRSGANER